ncbi:MAG: S8 family serine peptidase, partial [Planctomycetes bacterium]|nr:S8 family serine peptidase [Planctomycetota bacterium]
MGDKNQILSSVGGGNIKRNFNIVPGLSVVTLPAGMTVEEALQQFNGADGILYAQPNYEVKAISTFPDDPRFDDLWGMHNTGQTGGTADADIDAPEAWDISTGSSEIIVAVIDTGVGYTHPDLAANMWVNEAEKNGTPGVDDDGNGYVDDIYGYDFCNYDGDPMDDHYHGTHCAGTIGGIGNNSEGVAGVNWNVRIMALKFLSASGGGWTDDAIKCIEYSTLMGANLSSNSWGGDSYSQGLKDAIDAAGAAGMLFAAAAGNDNEDTDVHPHYPSSYDCESIISVMATDHSDNKAGFSCWGPVSVDLGAPGVDILSCQLGGGYKYASGTSMATPHVAGACALIWSMNPAMSN